MKKLGRLFGALAVCSLPVTLLAAIEPNNWQAVDGVLDGDWSDTNHWSLGHIPASGERACFDVVPTGSESLAFTVTINGDYKTGALGIGAENETRHMTVTFAGKGSVEFSRGSLEYIYECDGVIMDGPDFRLTVANGTIRCFAPLTLRGGSTWCMANEFQLWRGSSSLALEEDSVFSVGAFLINNLNDSQIVVNDGCRLCVRGDYRTEDEKLASKTARMDLLVNGGDVTVDGTLALTTRATDTVKLLNGGTLRLSKAPALLDASAQFDVAGGAVARTDVDLEQDDAFDAKTTCGCNVFKAVGGKLLKRRGTFYVTQFTNTDADAAISIDCDRLVFGGDGSLQPFVWTKTRDTHLYGPMTIFKSGDGDLKGEQKCYKFCHGKIQVDTRDFTNPSVTRTIGLRGIGSADGSLELEIFGGGVFKTAQMNSYDTCRSVKIGEGTTLTLLDRNGNVENYGVATEWGPLATETLTLEKGVTVTFKAGSNFITASRWEIDETVEIQVTIPDLSGYPDYHAFPILQDLNSNPLPDGLLGQIKLSGMKTGWKLKNEYGQITVYREPNVSQIGIYSNPGGNTVEWQGGAADANWTTAANWVDTPALSANMTHVFGAATEALAVFNGTKSTSDTTIGTILFQTNAVTSFFVDGAKQVTYNWGNRSQSIVSHSAVPQLLANGMRVADSSDGNRAIRVCNTGPIVFSAKRADGTTGAQSWVTKNTDPNITIDYLGDVRYAGKVGDPCSFSLSPVAGDPVYPAYRTCFTVLDKGALSLPKQATDLGVKKAGIRVCEGGTLAFTSKSTLYKWTKLPAKFTVDGVMKVSTKFHGGSRQVYGGSGELQISGKIVPASVDSTVCFADALKVTIAADTWPTEQDGVALALGATAGSPTLQVASNWSYGSGSAAATAARARAFTLENGATANIDPQGGVATLNEAVTGFGTLAITGGTLVVNGTCLDAEELGFSARTGSTLEFTGSQAFGSLSLDSGATLKMPSGASLTLEGDAAVNGVTLDIGAVGGKQWRTILTSKHGNVVGTPLLPDENVLVRVRTTDEGTVLQCKEKAGLCLILK